jgi:hypothetical protein
VTPNEVLRELDRLGITIFYQQLGPDQDPDMLHIGNDGEHVYPELRRAIEERTPEILKLARFEPSRGAVAVYLRTPREAE